MTEHIASRPINLPTFPRIRGVITDRIAEKGFLIAVLCLLTGDLLLLSADVLHRTHVLSDDRFLVTREGGFGEMFQYFKAATASLLLALFAARRTSATAATWAFLLAVVLIDDALAVHEKVGVTVAAALGLPGFGSVRPNHLGEVVFFGLMGVVFGGGLLAAWRFGRNSDRMVTLVLMPSFGALVICAVVLDLISSVTRPLIWAPIFALLEDGGEMVAMSVLLSIVYAHVSQTSAPARSVDTFRGAASMQCGVNDSPGLVVSSTTNPLCPRCSARADVAHKTVSAVYYRCLACHHWWDAPRPDGGLTRNPDRRRRKVG